MIIDIRANTRTDSNETGDVSQLLKHPFYAPFRKEREAYKKCISDALKIILADSRSPEVSDFITEVLAQIDPSA